jgi:hypothetical protein
MHALRGGGVGKCHSTNPCGINTDRQLSFPSIGRDGTGAALVAKSSESGQDGTKDGLRHWHRDGFFRFHSDGANATLVSVPVELKSLLLA